MLTRERVVRELFRPSESNPTYGLWWWLLGRRASRSRRRGPSRTTSAREAEYWATDAGERRARGAGAGARDRSARMPPWMPTDLVMAAGAGKQRLYVIPSRDLVIVRLGPLLAGRRFIDVEFLGALFGAV